MSEQKRLDTDREKIARIICCFAEENKSCSECRFNTSASPFPDCFYDIREDTDKLLALIPDIEEIKHNHYLQMAEDLAKQAIEVEEAKKQDRERILNLLPNITTRFDHNRTCFDCVERIKRQALKGEK